MVKASGNPKTPQFATGAQGAPKSNSANKSVTYGWSGRPDSNWRPPAPKSCDPLIWASMDSTTCRICLLNLEETTSYSFYYRSEEHTSKPSTKPSGSPD